MIAEDGPVIALQDAITVRESRRGIEFLMTRVTQVHKPQLVHSSPELVTEMPRQRPRSAIAPGPRKGLATDARTRSVDRKFRFVLDQAFSEIFANVVEIVSVFRSGELHVALEKVLARDAYV